MIELRQQPSFSLETLSHSHLTGQRLFQRDAMAEAQIRRLIDCAHSAAADRAQNAIAALQNGVGA